MHLHASARPATHRSTPLSLGLALLLATVLSLALLSAGNAAPTVAPPRAADAGPDLTIDVDEILLNPANPNANQLFDLELVFRNIGTQATQNTFVYIYVNPAQRPPTLATAHTARITVFPIQPGQSLAVTVDDLSFPSNGCDNYIYLWIDRDQGTTDANRDNNVVFKQFCIGVQCELDDFELEGGDNSSTTAQWIVPNVPQLRSFCRDQNGIPTPQGDTDWVKLTAFAGLTYTLALTNTGIHAEPRLTLWSGNVNTVIGGPAAQISWVPPATGIYFAQVVNNKPDNDTGPLTRYELLLSAVPAIMDAFEPDDTCGQARPIPVDGTPQIRLFQSPGDIDWVKFTLSAGQSFALIADQTAQGVNPEILLFNECVQSLSTARAGAGLRQVQGRALEDQTFYARITNQNPNHFGADASYRLRVSATTCLPDSFEDDDTREQAKELQVNQPHANRNFCPAGDHDWVKFNLQAGQSYILKTTNLGEAADTVLELWTAGGVQIAVNDDYDYVKASRITFEPSVSGTYYGLVRHNNPLAAGPGTHYDLILETGFCMPDEHDDGDGDNSPLDAIPVPTDGSTIDRNFCADPTARNLGDQDWMRFQAKAGARYRIYTEELGPNADTVLRLYDRNGTTLLRVNDDRGLGLAAEIVFTPTVAGEYFIQATQFNPSVLGRETGYRVRIEENTPSPTPTPTPTPPPTPPPPLPTPDVDTSGVRTLILVNEARLRAVHGNAQAGAIMNKVFDLSGHDRVQGAVVHVETNPQVAAAYTAWLAALANPNASIAAKNAAANEVAAAIRNQVLSFAVTAPNLAYIVIVGDDRIIPFFRIAEGALAKRENEYAQELASATSSTAVALAEDMILTDDYYAAREPNHWRGNEFYVPQFAIGRLVQEPDEIIGQIDHFFANQVIDAKAGRALITGYDFVQDSAQLIRTLMQNDQITVHNASLIGPVWTGGLLRAELLAAGKRYELISINGHATHDGIGVPLPLGDAVRASEIITAAADLTRALVYNVGCHGGLNDTDGLDLAQAFVRRGAIYVGNTGYGWGGGGIVFSEAVMRNFTRELLTNTRAEVGPALSAAKRDYVSRARVFGAYDAKVLMQTTLYGLPMYEVTSGGTFEVPDPFPSARGTVTPPTSFGAGVNRGGFGYSLARNFGTDDDIPGYALDLDDNIFFEAGAPIQPSYYQDLSAPAAGRLRGLLFRGGTYTDTVVNSAPIALAFNEYITDTTPPAFTAEGWYPPTPFGVRSGAFASGAMSDTAVLALGQFDATTGTQRVFGQMSFDTYFSDSPDRSIADINHVDAVLDPVTGRGNFKVETVDASDIVRVVIAFTLGTGQWSSADLAFDQAAFKWTGSITATAGTLYFVQVVDGAGNVSVDDNKGRYFPLLSPIPLATGRQPTQYLYLPQIQKGQ